MNLVDPTGHMGIQIYDGGGGAGGSSLDNGLTELEDKGLLPQPVAKVTLDDSTTVRMYADDRVLVAGKDGTLMETHSYRQPNSGVVVGTILQYGLAGEAGVLASLVAPPAPLVQVGVAGATGWSFDKTIGKLLDVPKFGQIDITLSKSTVVEKSRCFTAGPLDGKYCTLTTTTVTRDIRLFRDGSMWQGPWEKTIRVDQAQSMP